MLLQRLADYTGQLNLPPTLYAEAPVRYIVELDGTGRLLSPEPIDTANPAEPRERRGVRRHVPQVQRAVGIKPLLLADNAEYTFGLARDTSKPARVAACHEAYLDLLDRCATATGESAVGVVRDFLRGAPLAQLELATTFDRGAALTFRVDGEFLVDLPAVQAFWAAANDPSADPDRPAPIMQCLVCGQDRPVLDRLQAKIKGVPGGQTSGTAIISANAGAFESYGLEASLIAPTCATCGERFTKAINALLADQSSHIVLGGAAFVFWTRQPTPEIPFRELFTQPDSAQAREALATIRTGKSLPDIEEIAFYGTVLSGSGGRAVVRDWIDTTVGNVLAQLRRWFARQHIVDPYGQDGLPLGLYALAAATVRDPRTDLAPPTTHALLHGALNGTPLPMDLLYQAVRRNRAEQCVRRARAALIKLVLLSRQSSHEENAMVQLDPHHPSVAYHCGRLLAVLEAIQRGAIRDIKATIVDRFFGTASSAPIAVFARLLRGAQPHLTKLERDRPPVYFALQRRLEEILANVGAFPRTLTLEEQGLFALGYYHQRAFDRAQAREASERRKAGLPPAAQALPEDTFDTDSQDKEE
jgi:CRISPR-associated protein Csd1